MGICAAIGIRTLLISGSDSSENHGIMNPKESQVLHNMTEVDQILQDISKFLFIRIISITKLSRNLELIRYVHYRIEECDDIA